MEEKQNKNDKGSIGCFIACFFWLAIGIPAATKGEGPIGTIVIVIVGLAISYYFARTMSGYD